MNRERDSERRFVITGGPGSGKSTLIDALRRQGLACSDEVGRRIIREQMTIGGRALPWIDPAAFAEAMLLAELENYRNIPPQGIALFDRGIPDVVGYMRLVGLPVPAPMHEAAKRKRYSRRVFIAPPWPEIYAQDGERKQSLEEAARTYEQMIATYIGYGYDLLELPRVPVDARATFVLEEISRELQRPAASRSR